MNAALKKLLSAWLLMITLFAATGSCSVQAFTLIFKDTALTDDTIFYLSDIAEVKGADSETKEKLQSMVAGDAAPAGFSRFFNVSDFIVYRMRPRFNDLDFNVSGSQRVVVKTGFIEKRVGDYLPLIEEHFRRKVLWPDGCWEMSVLEPQRSWKSLPVPVTAQIEGLETGYPRGHVQVNLVMCQGQRKIRVPVACKVRVVTPVLVAKRAIVRGQEIGPGDYELRPVDITGFGPQPLSGADALQGVRAARSISPGSVIHTRLVQPVPDVAKGESVEILVHRGRVRVSVQGIAREAGMAGEKIWVENMNSRKLIQAIIKAKGTVTIAQGGLSI